MNERLWRVLKKYAIILGAGLIYLAWVLITDLRIPCPIYLLSGLKCPGCGVTRMIVSLVKLDFAASLGYNPFLLLTSPIILLCIAVSEYRFVRYGEYRLGKLRYALWAELVLAIAFGVLRNLVLL